MTDHGRAYIMAKMRRFTSLTQLRGWWDNNAIYMTKNDPHVLALNNELKGTLK